MDAIIIYNVCGGSSVEYFAFYVISGAKLRECGRVLGVEVDTDGDALFHLDEVACSVVDWYEGEGAACGVGDAFDGACECCVGHGIGCYTDAGSWMDVGHLALFVVGFYPDVVSIDDVE